MKRWKPGDVLIEKQKLVPRPVVVVECPPMFAPGGGFNLDLTDLTWGFFLEKSGHWGGPWYGDPDRFEPHPDPESIWVKWAEHCAWVLTK